MSDKFDDMANNWLNSWGLNAIEPAKDLSSRFRKVAQEQREADAKIAGEFATWSTNPYSDSTAQDIATAIRNQQEQQTEGER